MYTGSYPLIDTYLTHKSTEERGFAANKYGGKKNKDYRAITKAKNLNYHYMSLTFGTFGSIRAGRPRNLASCFVCPQSYARAAVLGGRHLPKEDDQRWRRPRRVRALALASPT
jgi:hypothetical protein